MIDGSTSLTIDNGKRRRLTVERLFDGEAGDSEGVLAFIPNVAVRSRKPQFCTEGVLDGRTVRLSFIAWNGPFATFRYGF